MHNMEFNQILLSSWKWGCFSHRKKYP